MASSIRAFIAPTPQEQQLAAQAALRKLTVDEEGEDRRELIATCVELAQSIADMKSRENVSAPDQKAAS
jgi:hypothetical protein